MSLMTKQIAQDGFDAQAWQRRVYSEFEATLTSKSRPFPCVYGTAGFQKDQLRFAFLEKIDAKSLAPILKEYLENSRDFGEFTSLAIFERPRPVASMERYRKRFWNILEDLTEIDEHAWPAEIPEEMDHKDWEFCFNGEPVFVVCNSPAHVLRQSRRSTAYMMTFQPRWVFETLTGTEKKADAAFGRVRKLLEPYDMLSPAPGLGRYGDPSNREYAQYFIDDSNSYPACPAQKLNKPKGVCPVAHKEKVA